MPSGGARSRSGPPPDLNALRRDRADDAAGWETLPSAGRPGDPPPWPLMVSTGVSTRISRSGEVLEIESLRDREIELWRELWKLPQAIVWERNRLTIPVALFVRQLAEGELPHSSAENRKTIKMYLSDLYLTSDSLARARLKIGTVEVVKTRTFRKTGGASHLAIVVPPGE